MSDRRTRPEPGAKRARRSATAAACDSNGVAVPKVRDAGVRALERRVRELTAALEAATTRHARQLAAVRRAADRQLAELMREIVSLRYHEARAEMLARLLAEREESNTHGQAPGATGR